MKKAEEEAIRRARREIVRVRGIEEKGVLGDLIYGTGVASEKQMAMHNIVDVSEDEMDEDD